MRESDFDEYFALRRAGDYRAAYGVLARIIKDNPRWSRVGDLYVWCGELELLLNDDIHRALEYLERAGELGCRSTASYLRQHGYVLWRLGEREKGIQELEQCVELEPTIANLRTLGEVLSQEQDPRAFSVWQHLLEKDPRSSCAHAHVGREMARSGDRGKALLMIKRAEHLSPSVEDTIGIAGAYFELGEFQSAIEAYLEADRLGYAFKGPLYAAVAECYFSIGDPETGQRYLRWAVRHDPEHDSVKSACERHDVNSEHSNGHGYPQ